jgi:CMP-N-acetylneuraminic acid synthetase
MKELGKVVMHIPAREGSKRVPRKNLRLMNGKPMISYVIEAVLQSKVTENCYVNTDAEELIGYVNNTYPKMKIYLRAKELCNDRAQSDDFNADIIKALQPDTLIMINPVCPLIDAQDIQKAVEVYKKGEVDTLISSCSTHMQTFCKGKPVNIDVKQPLAPSQENPAITTLNWAITIWEAKLFLRRMEEKGFGVWGDKLLFYDIEPFKAVKVSEESDFILAEKLIKIQESD